MLCLYLNFWFHICNGEKSSIYLFKNLWLLETRSQKQEILLLISNLEKDEILNLFLAVKKKKLIQNKTLQEIKGVTPDLLRGMVVNRWHLQGVLFSTPSSFVCIPPVVVVAPENQRESSILPLFCVWTSQFTP